jgi:putative redox protein
MEPEMAAITASHEGGDRILLEVRGHQIRSDQPVEDEGGDTAPTPTELFLAGLAGCITFFAERFLRRHGLITDGLLVTCEYSWAESPHRVGSIELSVDAPNLPVERREAFLRVIEHCTLHNTLRHPPELQVRLVTGQTVVA